MTRENRDQLLFDAIATQYARKDIALSSALARKNQLATAMRLIPQENGQWGTIVDVGCGIGAPAKYLHGQYQRYIGIDQSPEMIEAAIVFNRDHPQATFLADNIKETQLPRNTADVILSVGALHHMSDLDKVMESLAAIAKPGAALVVIEPQNANPLIQMMRWIRGLIDKGYSREQVFFSEAELADLFNRHGISHMQIRYEGYVTTPFAQVIASSNAVLAAFSKLAIQVDNWLQNHLRGPLQRLSFNIIITGLFPTRNEV